MSHSILLELQEQIVKKKEQDTMWCSDIAAFLSQELRYGSCELCVIFHCEVTKCDTSHGTPECTRKLSDRRERETMKLRFSKECS